MPAVKKEVLDYLIEEMEAVSMIVNLNTKRQALIEREEYLKGNIKDLSSLLPLSIYYILRKFSDSLQIQFIEEHLNYLKDHTQDIFLVGMESPKELSYYFSYSVLQKIYELDPELFEKLNQGQVENIFYGFSQEEYLSYLKEFQFSISKLEPCRFISIFENYNGILYRNLNFENFDIHQFYQLRKQYNDEFLRCVIENYYMKIDGFSAVEFFRFISCIEDLEQYKKLLFQRREKLSHSFESIDIFQLWDIFTHNSSFHQQEILFQCFYDIIVRKFDVKDYIYKLDSSMILELFRTHKEIFCSMSLLDWIKLCNQKSIKNYPEILDEYNICDLEDFYNEDLIRSVMSTKELEYLEKKYRDTLTGEEVVLENQINSIFSVSYLMNLNYLQVRLKNRTIQKEDPIYQENFEQFVKYFRMKNIIQESDDSILKQLDFLFRRIIMGYPLTRIHKIKTIQDVSLVNRLGDLKFHTSDFTKEQLDLYHVQEHKQLLEIVGDDFLSITMHSLILKLLLLIGFQNAKKLLEIDHDYGTLEHLVGNVNVQNISLDASGNPKLNKKILNLLFQDFHQFEEYLKDKSSDVYKYFPRIFNEWENIVLYGKHQHLKTVIEFLKSSDLSVAPNYYRLNQLFRYIGCNSTVVEETFRLHDEMLERTSSTIPKVCGTVGEYTYEVLDLQDMEALTLGNKTSCCFTVLGNGYSCLKHATTSLNGRVLVVKKGERLLAHSWIWRNGNLLCIDNVEVDKSLYNVNFLDVYLDFSEKILQESFLHEGFEQCIQNVTIGRNKSDVLIVGLENFPCIVSKDEDVQKKFEGNFGKNPIFVDELPQPIESVTYSDSKFVQYFIRGNRNVRKYQSSYLYQDQREEVFYFDSASSYSDEYIKQMNDLVNSLRYIKAIQNQSVETFYLIDVLEYSRVFANRDWYMLQLNDDVETFIYTFDKRAYGEMESVCGQKTKKLQVLL